MHFQYTRILVWFYAVEAVTQLWLWSCSTRIIEVFMLQFVDISIIKLRPIN